MESTASQFKHLFNKYRLRAGFETLNDFGNKLASEGYAYEDSMFSRWKHGTRIPKNRKIILAMIKIFIRYHGINTVEEANDLLYSLDFTGLHWEEIKQIAP